jgi:hypothetical protein
LSARFARLTGSGSAAAALGVVSAGRSAWTSPFALVPARFVTFQLKAHLG